MEKMMRDLGTTFGELKRNSPPDIKHHIEMIAGSLEHDAGEDVGDDYDMVEACGGGFFLVESEDDLDQIPTCTVSEGGRYLTIREVSDAFDICEWLEGEEHIVVFNACTDAGGASYFIPAALVTMTVLESIDKTEGFWADGE